MIGGFERVLDVESLVWVLSVLYGCWVLDGGCCISGMGIGCSVWCVDVCC